MSDPQEPVAAPDGYVRLLLPHNTLLKFTAVEYRRALQRGKAERREQAQAARELAAQAVQEARRLDWIDE